MQQEFSIKNKIKTPQHSDKFISIVSNQMSNPQYENRNSGDEKHWEENPEKDVRPQKERRDPEGMINCMRRLVNWQRMRKRRLKFVGNVHRIRDNGLIRGNQHYTKKCKTTTIWMKEVTKDMDTLYLNTEHMNDRDA